MFNKYIPLRNSFLTLALGAALLAGCGSSGSNGDAATRTVHDALGTVKVPTQPQRVLALDEHSAMALLTVGVKPDLVYATVSSASSKAALESEGVTVEDQPTFLSKPDFEMVVADKPDLIVGSGAGPLPASIDKFRAIAPTVVLSYDKPWRESLEQLGEIFDADDAVNQVTEAIEARIAEISGEVTDGTTMSVAFSYENSLHYPSPDAPMSRLLDEVGFDRPEAETKDAGLEPGEFIVEYSDETFDDHDADYMAVLSQTYYDADALRAQPLFKTLKVAQDDHAIDVDGETWWGNSVFTTWWILDDVDAMLHGDATGTVGDAVERWKAFTEAVDAS